MFYWCFHFFDTIYACTTMSYGIAPGVVGSLVCFFLPFYARWPVPLVMLFASAHGVRSSAHSFEMYLIGCTIYVLFSVVGLYARSKRSGTGLMQQHPYDLLLFAAGTLVLAVFYGAPLM